MDIQTVLIIILAAIVSLGLVLFQYFYKSKKAGKLPIILSLLRFVTWFCAFLLLINPKFSKDEYTITKANLLVLSDNSSSISKYREQLQNSVNKLNESDEITSKFKLNAYNFGSKISTTDTLSFTEKTTNIANALNTLQEIYSKNDVVVLLSDGNQTFGTDYVNASLNSNLTVYPIVIGDTTLYEDIRVDQVNANKYAFLKNKYPIELFITYEGGSTILKTVTISLDGKKVFSENLRLSSTDNTRVINTLLDAGSVGVKYLEVAVSTIDGERNITNNKKSLTVEVIDEKTNIAIVSDMLHPDIGVLKKSIERNEQRSVAIIKPSEKNLDAYDIFILYQPTATFKSIYEYINTKKANIFSILGPNTDLRFVNGIQKQFRIEDNYPIQEIIPVKNEGFSKFDISQISFDDFPPLDSDVGPIGINGEHETLLKMQIKGVSMASPLLAVLTDGETKNALLLGENIWKWRIQDYRNNQSFRDFDELIGKLMIYLSDNKSKERLTLDFKSVYEGSTEARIHASYFDETFEFDSNASLVLHLKNSDTDITTDIPMLLNNGFYEADLSNQSSGEYQFTVSVKNENLSKSGSFRILDYDVEQQFVSANAIKLKQLAENSEGKLFYSDQIDELIKVLTGDERYLPVQKSIKKIVSLIDFRILLGFIAFALTLEWLIRKYNGLT
ncbi:VWA domain-containing protein [Aurantibacter crassamenti]|uniref:VWA domain-containing protein n=1 Tax=Aurantibacter crassamenti TaxID=1837375 RepID=UPI001939A9CE|nr:VWA domain-containing protein [Aurantibacter crassamenti]MBM1106992.1 VWA domain-containing protein [Aurantibacter crassamenti]